MALLVMVAAAGLSDMAPAVPAPHHYLKGAESRRPCEPSNGQEEIVVCGRDGESDRLREPDDAAFASPAVRAQVALGGGTTLGAGADTKTLTAAQRKAAPNERSVTYSKTMRLTLKVPLPAIR
ncbi:hypothetical protein [Sphingomonas bacterium]|uniref:hypothetical protein n=1 Tax=Sphingomonas bacterium TaxID=1895847 RepID=UPI00157762E3|nr:hypothetical protein [Sphingomonas bacterium]